LQEGAQIVSESNASMEEEDSLQMSLRLPSGKLRPMAGLCTEMEAPSREVLLKHNENFQE